MQKQFGLAAMIVGMILAFTPVSFSQVPGDVYMWEFNEGSGYTVTDNEGQFVANLGVKVVEDAIPDVISDSPSGLAGDNSIQINQGMVGTSTLGGLVVDDNEDPVLDIQDGPITIECWLQIDAFDGARGVVAYGSSYKVGFNADQLLFTFYGIEDVFSGVTMTVDGLWHHVAWAWEPGVGVNFYVDGALASTVPTTNTSRALQNHLLNIGSETNGVVPLLGKIDRVRVHHALLTEAELDSDAAAPKAPLADTIVSYGFNEEFAPFFNEAEADRPAFSTTIYNEGTTAPSFSSDSPTGESTDYSLSFDGNDRVIFTDEQDIMQFIDEDFTFEAWLKFDPAKQVTDRFVLFAYGIGGANGYSFSVRPGGARPVASDESPSGKAGDRSVHPKSGLIAEDEDSPILDIIDGPITTEAWVKLDSLTTYADILRYGNAYKMGYTNTGNLVWTFLRVVDIDSGIPAPKDNAWHHVAMAWDPGVGVHFYLDGDEVAFIETASANTDVQYNALNVGSSNSGSSPLDGLVDRVRVHKALLTASQLDSDAANPKAPLADTIVAYNFDEADLPYASATDADRPLDLRSKGSLLTVTTYGIIDAHSTDALIPNDGQWHHIAAAHETYVEFRYFVDGKLMETMPYEGGVYFAEVYDFIMGSEASGGNPYVGLLDRVKITRNPLNEGELDYFKPVAVSDWSLF